VIGSTLNDAGQFHGLASAGGRLAICSEGSGFQILRLPVLEAAVRISPVSLEPGPPGVDESIRCRGVTPHDGRRCSRVAGGGRAGARAGGPLPRTS